MDEDNQIDQVSPNDFEDKTIVCKDCSKEFIFSVGEQKFFAEKGLKNLPARCPDCRKARRAQEEEDVRKFEISCAQCGKKGRAPFEVEPNQIYYCDHCFEIIKRKADKEKIKTPSE